MMPARDEYCYRRARIFHRHSGVNRRLTSQNRNKVDIRSSDIVLALVPVVLWLFLTGGVQGFVFGEVKIVAVIKMA
jgi:hypothetical protein